ncbi:MAG: RHS repeat protein, partial [Planctomycetes bacterium]|nr:RHS repeat protein [Planctomycetota bacterium]
TTSSRTYVDTDEDGIPDLNTDFATVNGKTATIVHDIKNNFKKITTPENRTVTTTYDPNTLLTDRISIPGLLDTTFSYDDRGRIESTTTGTRGITYVYNNEGLLESVTAGSHTTSYTYDDVGRVTRVDRPDTSDVGFVYDKNGNMTVLTTPSIIDHDFGFNKVNLNNSYDAPLSGQYSYVYDKDRRLIQTNFPSGKQIVNIFDKTKLMQLQTPEGNIDFTHGCSDRVESITKGSEAIALGYDGNLLTSETRTGIINQTLSYAYNNDLNSETFTYAGVSDTFTYDNDDLLTGAGSFTITRNAENGLPETVNDSSFNLSRTFDGYGEITDQAFSVNNSLNLTSWSLIRDNSGRIVSKSETIDGVISNYIYTYDPMGRLLTVKKDDTLIEEYQYGPNGARSFEMNTQRGIAG